MLGRGRCIGIAALYDEASGKNSGPAATFSNANLGTSGRHDQEAIVIQKRSLLALTLLFTQVGIASATTVQHCIGERGEPSYTFGRCANGEPGKPLRARNHPPGSVTPGPVSSPQATANTSSAKRPVRDSAIATAPMPQRDETRQATGSASETKSRKPVKKTKKKPARYAPWR